MATLKPEPTITTETTITATPPTYTGDDPFGPLPSVTAVLPLVIAFVVAAIISFGRVLREFDNLDEDTKNSPGRVFRQTVSESLLGGFAGVAFPLFIDTTIADLSWPGALLTAILGGAIGYRLLSGIFYFLAKMWGAIKGIDFTVPEDKKPDKPEEKPKENVT